MAILDLDGEVYVAVRAVLATGDRTEHREVAHAPAPKLRFSCREPPPHSFKSAGRQRGLSTTYPCVSRTISPTTSDSSRDSDVARRRENTSDSVV